MKKYIKTEIKIYLHKEREEKETKEVRKKTEEKKIIQ